MFRKFYKTERFKIFKKFAEIFLIAFGGYELSSRKF